MGDSENSEEIRQFWELMGRWEYWSQKKNEGVEEANEKIGEVKASLTRLIDSGFTLNQVLEDPETPGYEAPPLFMAVERGRIDFVEFFLDMGADPNYIPDGIGAIYGVKEFDATDTQILQLLMERGALLLPHYPKGYTLIDHLLWKREEFLRMKNEAIEAGEYAQAQRYAASMRILRHQLELLQPWSSVIKHLRIEAPDGRLLYEMYIDARATVSLVKLFLVNFVFERRISVDDFDLIMPAFQHPNESKKKMEDERALTDYNIQDGTRLVLIPKVRAGLKGGKRKATRRQKRRGRKTRTKRKH